MEILPNTFKIKFLVSNKLTLLFWRAGYVYKAQLFITLVFAVFI